MTAGQNAGQLHRANTSGMYVVVAAAAAGVLVVGILATQLVARPAAVAPAAAPIPVPPIEFRLSEHSSLTPLSIPVPSIDFRLSEKDLTIAPSSSIVGAHPLGRAADQAAKVSTGAASSTATHPHGKAVSPVAPATKSTNSYSRWGMNAQ
jgi:hypothetical protein